MMMHVKMMKKRRQISVNKIRLTLISIVAMQFTNLCGYVFSHISLALSDIEEPQNFQDINFSNTTLLDGIARKAMKRLHDDLDHDDDGNVSLSEGAKYIDREDFIRSGGSNLPGFATDKDGRITEEEFWESWARSPVHNWTAAEMADWLTSDVDLPQLAMKFKQHGISGAAMPILASNSSLVLTLVGGVKEHRLKLWLKAMEVVLCGYTPSRSSLLKDALLTISILLALGGLAYAAHVRRNAAVAMTAMQLKLNNLQNEMQELDKEEAWIKDIASEADRESEVIERGSHSSLFSDSELQSRMQEVLEELSDTRTMLEQAEEKLNDRKWSPPSRLLTCLKNTHKVEMKLHEAKRQQAQKQVEQAKSQFLKMKKKTSIFTSVQLIHSRQVDSFDLEVQAAKDLLREVQLDGHDYRRRWTELGRICNTCFVPTSSKMNNNNKVKSEKPLKSPSSTYDRKRSSGFKLKVNGTDVTYGKPKSDSENGVTHGNFLIDVADCLLMKDVSPESSDTDSNKSFISHRSSPSFNKTPAHVPDHRRSEPISHSSGSLGVKIPSNLKSPSPIPEGDESSDSETFRTASRKASPKLIRKGSSQFILIEPPKTEEETKAEKSPVRSSTMAAIEPRTLIRGASPSHHSLPDLGSDLLSRESSRDDNRSLQISINSSTEEENGKSFKKRSNFGNLFKRKKKP